MSEENPASNEIENDITEEITEEISPEIAEVAEAIEAKVQVEGETNLQTPRAPRSSNKQNRKGTATDARQKGGGHGGKRRRRGEERSSRTEEASEFTEKVVQVRRVTKVVKGGKKMSFRAAVVIGNEKGKVAVGVGKAAEVLIAIKKAISDARKQVVEITTVSTTISHSVYGRAGGSKILLKPAAEGTGIIAGGTARIVLELAGVGDILAKSQGSKSPINVARATLKALQSLRTFQEVAQDRGLSVKEMLH